MATLNVTKRGDVWQYRFEVAKIDGKRKRVSKSGFKTKKEATEAGTKALAEYNEAGQAFKPSEISVADYLDYWMDTYGKMNLKYNTQVNYYGVIENHLKPAFGMYRLKAISPATIQEFVNKLKIKGLKRNTIVDIMGTLSASMKYAVEPLKYIQFNPCDRVKYPSFDMEKKYVRFVISQENFKRIIERFDKSTPFYVPFMIGYYTGVRLAECFGLTWDNIDLENRTITIEKTMIKRNFNLDTKKVMKKIGKREEKSKWYFNTPKTRGSYRTIKFGDTLYNVLKEAYKKRKENELFYGEYYTKIYKKPEIDEKGDTIYRLEELEKSIPCTLEQVELVCIREDGRLLSMDAMKYANRIIHHELMIDFNYHSLRHTHATTLIENGANIKDVQERLGHTLIQTTLDTYTHNTDFLRNMSVDIFENAVKEKEYQNSTAIEK